MRADLRIALYLLPLLLMGILPAAAQNAPGQYPPPQNPPGQYPPQSDPYPPPQRQYQPPPPPQSGPPPSTQYAPGEIMDAGHRFFGGVSRGLASVIEKAISQWGLPNGYILGQEGGGAFIGGLRYGEGTLYTKNAGDLRVFWQGPTARLGFRRRRRPHHDAGLQPAGHGSDLPALRRRRRLGLPRRRLRHDGADRQQHRAGADPLRTSGCGSAPTSATSSSRRSRPGTRSEAAVLRL